MYVSIALFIDLFTDKDKSLEHNDDRVLFRACSLLVGI